MYYAFTTKAADSVLTGPTLLVSSGLHRLTPVSSGLSGIQSMSVLQMDPLRVSNMTGGGADEYFRFEELWDPYPSSVTTLVDTLRPLLAEELFNLIKRMPLVIVTVPGGNGRRPVLPPGAMGGSAVRHLNSRFLPLPPPPPPPTPQYFSGGEMIRPVGGAEPVFTVSNPFVTLTYENPFLQFGTIIKTGPEVQVQVEAGVDGRVQGVGGNPSPMPNSAGGVWLGNPQNPGTDVSPYAGATEETEGLEWPPLNTNDGGRGRTPFVGRRGARFQGPIGRRRNRWDQ